MDDITMKALNVVLNEKRSEYIKHIDMLKFKEKQLFNLKTKLEIYYEELFLTFTTLAHLELVEEDDSDDEDYNDFVTKNNHLINVLQYDKEYTAGFMDCLKSIIVSYDKYITTDNHLKYGEVRQLICNEINI